MQTIKYLKPTQAKLAKILRCPNETDRFIKSWESINALSEDKNYYLKNVCDPEALSDEFGDIDDDLRGLTIHDDVEFYFTEYGYMTDEDHKQEALLVELEVAKLEKEYMAQQAKLYSHLIY